MACALVLSGCSWMEGSYVSVKPHQVGYRQDDWNDTVITGYSQLRTAITSLVDNMETEAVFSLSDYSEEIAGIHMETVIHHILHVYPIGTYAVKEITYEIGQNLLSVHISYSRSRTEIDRIQTVRGIDGAKAAIEQALGECANSLTLMITGFVDVDFVQYIADYAALHPEIVMELPQVSTQLYPRQGNTRILELQFMYQTSRSSLRDMASQVKPVFSSARLYVSSDADDGTRLSQLYSFLMERFDYTVQTSLTPSYSLLCHGVGDSRAFSQIYAAMCRQSGLEAMTVSGTCNGESRFWNIVRNGDLYYHVDLLECARQGYYQEKTDEEMDGYVWDYSAFPPCGYLPEETTIPETTAP